MIDFVPLLVVAAAIVALYFAADRARTIAVCRVESGALKVVRGRLPARVLTELRDVVARMRVAHGTLVVRKEGGRPALIVRGVRDENARQQLRNVLGRFQLAELR